jgi:hypothetical protein
MCHIQIVVIATAPPESLSIRNLFDIMRAYIVFPEYFAIRFCEIAANNADNTYLTKETSGN